MAAAVVVVVVVVVLAVVVVASLAVDLLGQLSGVEEANAAVPASDNVHMAGEVELEEGLIACGGLGG